MNTPQIITATEKYVQQELKSAEGGHDWWHIQRVWHLAKAIAQKEEVNMLVVELGALLHDIADSKFHQGNEEIGPQKAKAFLKTLSVDEETITHVLEIIKTFRLKGEMLKPVLALKNLMWCKMPTG